MRVVSVAVVVSAFATGALAHAQTGWQSITFHFQRETPAERYTIYLDEAGNGSYWEGGPDFDRAKASGDAIKPIRATSAMAKLPFALIGPVGEGNCETHAKNIAQSGQKTLLIEVVGKEVVKCTFNYSDDDQLNAASDAFQAIAETMQFGARLAHEHRFDRLSLDAEMTALSSEAKAGRAIELQNIASVLRSIAEDEHVISRARREAARLLEDAEKSSRAPEGKSS